MRQCGNVTLSVDNAATRSARRWVQPMLGEREREREDIVDIVDRAQVCTRRRVCMSVV
jgi:hypothetical protein